MSSCSDRSMCASGEHIVLALAVAALAANLLVHLDRQVIVADVHEYWLHDTTHYNQLMILALSENNATQELLHRRHPELRVLWLAGLVEFVAQVIVADVDEYWLHDHTRYLQLLRTEAVKWILPPRIIRERSAAMGLEYFISPRVGFYFGSPRSQIGRTLTRVVDTVPPGNAGRGRHS